MSFSMHTKSSLLKKTARIRVGGDSKPPFRVLSMSSKSLTAKVAKADAARPATGKVGPKALPRSTPGGVNIVGSGNWRGAGTRRTVGVGKVSMKQSRQSPEQPVKADMSLAEALARLAAASNSSRLLSKAVTDTRAIQPYTRKCLPHGGSLPAIVEVEEPDMGIRVFPPSEALPAVRVRVGDEYELPNLWSYPTEFEPTTPERARSRAFLRRRAARILPHMFDEAFSVGSPRRITAVAERFSSSSLALRLRVPSTSSAPSAYRGVLKRGVTARALAHAFIDHARNRAVAQGELAVCRGWRLD